MKIREQKIKEFEVWFKWSIGLSLSIMIVYTILHMFFEGKEVRALSPEQLSTINALIIKADTSKNEELRANKIGIQNFLKVNLLVSFNEDTLACKEIDTLVKTNSLHYLMVVLPNYPFEVRSFFWLKGFKIYAELLFWIWFGVMASVLYTVVNAYNAGKFSKKLVNDHIAKLLYAPPVGIALYLSSNLLSSQSLISSLDKISYGSIVFVFILGFFSGRSIELLNRLKEVLIPLNTANTNTNQPDNTPTENTDLFGDITIGDDSINNVSLNKCEIRLSNQNSPSKFYTTTSDSNGNFEFADIPLGLYQLEANLVDSNLGLTLGAKQNIIIEKKNTTETEPLNIVINKKP